MDAQYKQQTITVLEHLKRHGSITPEVAWDVYHIERLAAVIHTLREKFEISTVRTAGKKSATYVWGKDQRAENLQSVQKDVGKAYGQRKFGGLPMDWI